MLVDLYTSNPQNHSAKYHCSRFTDEAQRSTIIYLCSHNKWVAYLGFQSPDITVPSSLSCIINLCLYWIIPNSLKTKVWYSYILKWIPIFGSSFPFSYCVIHHLLEELSTHFNSFLSPPCSVCCFCHSTGAFLTRVVWNLHIIQHSRHFFSSYLDVSEQLTPLSCLFSLGVLLFFLDGLFSTHPLNQCFCNWVLGPLLFP